MARARLIKPAFFGDVTLSEASRDARLLYAGLWQLMDRRGLMEYHPKLVKRDLFPYDDDVSSGIIEGWVWELVRIKRMSVVEWLGKRYLNCPHLVKHQQFHHKEHKNALIPDEVLTAPSLEPPPVQPEASPVLAPVEPRCSRTDTVAEADTVADTEAEAVPVPSRAHPVRTAAPEFLFDISDDVIRVWVKAYTQGLVIAQLPKCEAKWVSHPKRNQQGEKPLFINSWLAKAQGDAKKAREGPKGPRDEFDIRDSIAALEASGVGK